MADETAGFGTDLIDVTGLSLHDLNDLGDSTLAHSLRRLLDDDDAAPVAGFTAMI